MCLLADAGVIITAIELATAAPISAQPAQEVYTRTPHVANRCSHGVVYRVVLFPDSKLAAPHSGLDRGEKLHWSGLLVLTAECVCVC